MILEEIIRKQKLEIERLEKKNKKQQDRINKAIEYCDFGIKNWITDDGFVEEVLEDVKKILKGEDKE